MIRKRLYKSNIVKRGFLSTSDTLIETVHFTLVKKKKGTVEDIKTSSKISNENIFCIHRVLFSNPIRMEVI